MLSISEALLADKSSDSSKERVKVCAWFERKEIYRWAFIIHDMYICEREGERRERERKKERVRECVYVWGEKGL